MIVIIMMWKIIGVLVFIQVYQTCKQRECYWLCINLFYAFYGLYNFYVFYAFDVKYAQYVIYAIYALCAIFLPFIHVQVNDDLTRLSAELIFSENYAHLLPSFPTAVLWGPF
jgi:hypothetical protein